jgi:chromosome segregation protein
LLKLRRLDLSGFKSFVDPVSLDVHGGMTAIVGPNGCGKSNLADAVVWALGERSAKSLRGEKMEDVIFAGAKNRKPLGMAEVTLDFSSDNGFAAAEDGRITIGRRMFRSGESQYLINGKSVRLKDVKDLLMDTGLGIRAYSMIEQGKIGMILSGKPQERRRLLEEAAGITRYRERRRVAEFKLEEARANLERIDDVISEVERAVRSLKRQANAAQRYNSRQEEHRDLLRQVQVGRWSQIQVELSSFRQQIGGLVEREAELSAVLHREEAEHVEARETLERLSQELANRHSIVADLAATIEGKQEFLKGSQHRLQEIAERLAAGEATAEHRKERISDLGASLDDLENRRTNLETERERAASEVDEDSAKISQVEALVSEAEDRLESLRANLLGSINGLSSLRNRLHREQVEREKGELRRRHVADELERKTQDLQQSLEGKGEAQTRVEEHRASVQGTEQEIDQHQEALQGIYRQREETRQRLEHLETTFADLQRRQQVLTELEDQQKERRARLQEALQDAGLESRPFLSDRFEVPEGWAASLDLFLGELEDAILLEPEDDALGLAQTLTQGRAT